MGEKDTTKDKKLAEALSTFIEKSDWSNEDDRKYQSITQLKKEHLGLYRLILAIEREDWAGLQDHLEEIRNSLCGGEDVFLRAIFKIANLAKREKD